MLPETIRISDVNANQILHAIRTSDESWHMTGINWNGIMICTNVTLIKYIDELIYGRKFISVESMHGIVVANESGNGILNRQFMTCPEWLKILVLGKDNDGKE